MARVGLSALDMFVVVGTRGGFRSAAHELGVSPSAVSHAIGKLEERLGVRLISRSTRSVALTEAGRELLAQLRPALLDIDRALAAASEGGEAPSGLLRLTVPRSVTHHLLLPRLKTFAEAYPAVSVEIRADDALVDIVAGGFDAGLRLGESLEKEMIAVRVGPPQRMVALAAPAFLAARAPPRHPRDLVDHPCIATRFPGGALYRWEFEREDEQVEIAVDGPLIVNDNRLVLDAVVAGLGIGFVLESMAAAALARGEAVRLLEDWCATFPGFFLFYPSRRQMRPALRAFVTHLARTD